ncbi:EAL domain-containing protein [Lactiplantibacillus xiangfangensis]|uniref:Diguanylate cyclase phosphodiesterase domain-containing protein n=1 Tax=Lactiplantibacillus xiangfangensis TaxID=942150 RepID=A0A0R2MHR6_9LACO|nr:EAL domain-containing protein [Lactiplantibacillus xiangfangensis]KRO11696.1 diguanylate cyclase phosphodiesterase domain-containing protein [Lactiplantibacillus xiangfangensis]
MYRYFIQPQLDKFNNSLIGYEMLIRYRAHPEDRWTLPENFASIPIDVQISLLKATARELSLKIASVSINFNRKQFLDPGIAEAVIDAQKKLFPTKIVVEVTEEPGEHTYSNADMLAQIKAIKAHGLEFSLDDVGTGINVYDHIKPLLDYAEEIKFAMQNFRKEGREDEIPKQLKFWRDIARQYDARLILEGVENDPEDALANDLEIPLRQGYYYGKPHLFKLKADRC